MIATSVRPSRPWVEAMRPMGEAQRFSQPECRYRRSWFDVLVEAGSGPARDHTEEMRTP
jgi:hypothetical protein